MDLFDTVEELSEFLEEMSALCNDECGYYWGTIAELITRMTYCYDKEDYDALIRIAEKEAARIMGEFTIRTETFTREYTDTYLDFV